MSSFFYTFLFALFTLSQAQASDLTLERLGERLFFEGELSRSGTQFCGTCHSPLVAFVDPGFNGVERMASLGDNGHSLGDRQAPSALYARFNPPFHQTEEGIYKGGFFWDGRARTLSDQAGGPPLNPAEMNMPSKAAIIARLKDTEYYRDAFGALFNPTILDTPDAAYDALTQALAAFEKTSIFSPFSSKYDQYLRGEATLTPQEDLGRILFFSQQFTNCNQCHQLQSRPGAEQETFTNYEFHNIGLPKNTFLRQKNGLGTEYIDVGLAANPMVSDPDTQRGKFKVPTLRNVAVTGPYMHNGIFKDLETVIRFYNKFNSRNPKAQINPETNAPWQEAEIPDTVAHDILSKGDALGDKEIKALVAFLRTLTDQEFADMLVKQ